MKTTRLFIIFVFLAGILISPVWAEENPLASKKLTQALVEEVSGESAWNYTDMISHFDRVQASEGWHDAAVAIQKELEKIGYKDIILEGWPSDGTVHYYTFRSVIGWRAKKGELWLVAPTRQRLCSYDEIPLTLVKHSHSANVEAELVDVGPGVGEECYRNRDVKGKIVLTYGYSQDVVAEAVVKRGALGVVTWYPPDVRPGYPNMIRYTAIWPRWEDRDKIGFGFNLSKYQGAVLKRLLGEGKKVVLKAEVETEFYQGKIETLSAAFPGSVDPESELMIIGHLCHPTPSANDNGSGSGGMLEMARALKQMIDKGLIDPPRRTIRFLWVPEFNGTVPYIQAHLDRTKKTLAVINCDMIGEDFHKTGGLFRIFCTPDSNPSFLNDVVANFASLVESLNLKSINGSSHPFVYKVSPYSGGSDHVVFNDGALKVPSVMLNHGDTFHHTSLDTMDKVDSSELRRICVIALGSIYYLASASDAEAKDIAGLVARNGIGRLSEDYYDTAVQLEKSESSAALQAAYGQVLNVIKHSIQRESQALSTTLIFSRDKAIEGHIKSSAAGIANMSSFFMAEAQKRYEALCRKMGTKPGPVVLTSEEKMLDQIIPVRAEDFVCPLESEYLLEKTGEEVFKDITLSEDSAYEALNFVDGRRSVWEIANAVSAEYGPLDAQNVLAFFKVVEKAGLVSLKQVR